MNTHNEKFICSISKDDIPIASVIFKMNEYRTDKSISHYCIVEGKSDERFYRTVLRTKLTHPKLLFLYKDSHGGKTTVICIYKFFKNHFFGIMPKCIFIVDSDYDGLSLNRHDLSKDDEKCITVLPCYSIENYFFMNNNLETVFTILNKTGYFDGFSCEFSEYMSSILEYCAHKRTLIIKGVKYIEDYKERDIFIKCGDSYYNHKFLVHETQRMSKLIDKYQLHQEDCRSLILLRENTHLIKGKLLYYFLCSFLFRNCSINIDNDELYDTLVAHLDVCIDIKYYNKSL